MFLFTNTAEADVLVAEHEAIKYFQEIEHLRLPDPLSQILPETDKTKISYLLLPADGKISSYFGPRKDPIEHAARFHSGIDLANLKRSTIHASAKGRIRYSGNRGGCGLTIEIAHDDNITTRYCHLDMSLAKVGSIVFAGEVIGLMGNTGRSTGTHLHFEVIKNGRPIDPTKNLVF